MKKIDKLLLTSFFPPFVVTFFIALFVLIMQTLWVYIDDIIGKGASLGMITEFMFYLSISHFIMALPIAVLISSVMVMGNLAEHYELSSMKSAGLSLLRVMRPLMFACAGIAVFSWFTANFLTPVANLKFKSRLYDMRKQKPTLNMEEGIFNDDFEGYRVRIGEKAADNQTIKDVFIANHITAQKDRLNELIAKEGFMYTTADERFLVMELEDGEQFQEGNRYAGSKSRAPFVRTSFEKYTKIFDMQEFDINRTDEELFRTHYSMLSMNQLVDAIDSIDQQVLNRKETVSIYVDQYVNALKPLKLTEETTENTPRDTGAININISVTDTLKKDALGKTSSKKTASSKYKANYGTKKVGGRTVSEKNRALTTAVKLKTKLAEQTINQPLKNYDSILGTFQETKRQSYCNKAIQHARSIKSNAESAARFLVKTKEKRIKHVFELYSKYSFAVVCFVFLFIGAPMGALVRKGGFGYPLLIAIIFFMLFITLTLTFKRMAEAFVVPPILAVWLPNLIILPIGFFLTYKAMNDAKVFDTTRILAAIQWIRERFKRKIKTEGVE
ncbi:MAG: LptF/LptG family permease [Saprospiraceae bacterium]